MDFSEVNKYMKSAPFWPQTARVWFVHLEARFQKQKIHDNEMKYNYVIKQLEKPTADGKLRSDNDKYKAIKSAVYRANREGSNCAMA